MGKRAVVWFFIIALVVNLICIILLLAKRRVITKERFTTEMPEEVESAWNNAWGVGRCEPMAKFQDELSDTAAITRLEFINNLRLRRENAQRGACYMRMQDPVVGNQCSADNPYLRAAMDSGVVTGVRVATSAQPESIVPQTRCVLEVAQDVTSQAMESVWVRWGQADCHAQSKSLRQNTEHAMAAYRKLYDAHQKTLGEIKMNRGLLDTLKPRLEACTAEDEWLTGVMPVEKDKRDACVRDLDGLRSKQRQMKEYCESTSASLSTQQADHVSNLKKTKAGLEATGGVYKKASQDLNGKLALLQATEQYIRTARVTAEELEQSLLNEWRPKHATHTNTASVKRNEYAVCSKERAVLEEQTRDTQIRADICVKRNGECSTQLQKLKDGNGKLAWELSELTEVERRLRLELAKVQAQVELCDSNLNQCTTDRATHLVELEELRRRLADCLARLMAERNAQDGAEMNKLTAMRNDISAQLSQQGRKCDDPAPQPQARLVQSSNQPIGATQIPGAQLPSEPASSFRDPLDSEGKLVS